MDFGREIEKWDVNCVLFVCLAFTGNNSGQRDCAKSDFKDCCVLDNESQ